MKMELFPLSFVLILLVSGCLGSQSGSNSKMNDLISVGLSVEGTPSLGNEVELVASYNSGINLNNVYFDIAVPGEFEVVSGETRWTGSLNGSYQTRLKIIPRSTGTFQIASLACVNRVETGTGISCTGGGANGILVSVEEDGGSVSNEPYDRTNPSYEAVNWHKIE